MSDDKQIEQINWLEGDSASTEDGTATASPRLPITRKDLLHWGAGGVATILVSGVGGERAFGQTKQGTVPVISPNDHTLIRLVPQKGHQGQVNFACFSLDSKNLMVLSDSNKITIYDSYEGLELFSYTITLSKYIIKIDSKVEILYIAFFKDKANILIYTNTNFLLKLNIYSKQIVLIKKFPEDFKFIISKDKKLLFFVYYKVFTWEVQYDILKELKKDEKINALINSSNTGESKKISNDNRYSITDINSKFYLIDNIKNVIIRIFEGYVNTVFVKNNELLILFKQRYIDVFDISQGKFTKTIITHNNIYEVQSVSENILIIVEDQFNIDNDILYAKLVVVYDLNMKKELCYFGIFDINNNFDIINNNDSGKSKIYFELSENGKYLHVSLDFIHYLDYESIKNNNDIFLYDIYNNLKHNNDCLFYNNLNLYYRSTVSPNKEIAFFDKMIVNKSQNTTHIIENLGVTTSSKNFNDKLILVIEGIKYYKWDFKTGKRIEEAYVEKLLDGFISDSQLILTENLTCFRVTKKDSGNKFYSYDLILDLSINKKIFSVENNNQFSEYIYNGNEYYIVLNSNNSDIWIYDIKTWKPMKKITGFQGSIGYVAITPDGSAILVIGFNGESYLFDIKNGREIWRHNLKTENLFISNFSKIYFASDFVIITFFSILYVIDMNTGKEIYKLNHEDLLDVNIKNNILIIVNKNNIEHFDLTTKKAYKSFYFSFDIISATFSDDQEKIILGVSDGTTRIWDVATGKELCSLISFNDGSWAVTDPEGRYDASDPTNIEGLHWVIGLEPIPLHQLKERYHDPGLLAKKMGYKKEPLREVKNFADAKLYPDVMLAPRKDTDPTATFTLTNQGGGIGDFFVTLNGKRLDASVRGEKPKPTASKANVTLDLTAYARLCEPGQPNELQFFIKNADGTITSRGELLRYTPPGKAPVRPPRLRAIVAGISKYNGDALSLRYPAKDAEDFAQALRVMAKGNEMPLELVLLTAPHSDSGKEVSPDKRPTRKNLLAALASCHDLALTDILIVYLAGHGKSYGDLNHADYYYLAESATSGDIADPEVRKNDTISGSEIAALLVKSPAKKQFIVLDTCAAGKLVEQLADVREVSGSTLLSWEQMRDRTGVFLLAGCASDAVSYEATRFEQGLLTYSLLEAIHNGTALREGGFVDVTRLGNEAARRVEEHAKGIGGVQKPVFRTRSDARSFDVGRLTPETVKQIPLSRPMPVFVRSSFQEDTLPRDILGLTGKVDAALREATLLTSRGRETGRSFVFWDVSQATDAYQLGGRYSLKGDTLTLNAVLFQGEQEVARLEPIIGKKQADGLLSTEWIRALLDAVENAVQKK